MRLGITVVENAPACVTVHFKSHEWGLISAPELAASIGDYLMPTV